RPSSRAFSGLRSKLYREVFQKNLNESEFSHINRLICIYLDQGIATWRMPVKETFFSTLYDLFHHSILKQDPFGSPSMTKLFKLSVDECIHECLSQILKDQNLFESYIFEIILGTPGWSAIINQLETKSIQLPTKRPILLKELIALHLIHDLFQMKKKNHIPFTIEPSFSTLLETLEKPQPTKLHDIKMIWHTAYERSIYYQALVGVSQFCSPSEKPPSKIQALFCIDDRECSIRRHLESCNANVETFGTAGFFGMDFFLKFTESSVLDQNCPIVLKPKHIITATPTEKLSSSDERISKAKMDRQSHSLFSGWYQSQKLGLIAIVDLVKSVFRPGHIASKLSLLNRPEDSTTLEIFRSDKIHNDSIINFGYTLEELADRIAGQLHSIGLTKSFGKLIVLYGHGSTNVNNPHFAAYDCGACMGKPGSPNARVFAAAANTPSVRQLLRLKGIDLPDDTYFLAAIHDTTRDEVKYFELESIPRTHLGDFAELKMSMEKALELNSKERSRRFELVPKKASPVETLALVQSRSVTIFEPRPELTHTGNCLAIIGRRDLTKNLFLDRRAFLNSYNPNTDPEGTILESILSAVVPVCGGINLTYLLSRLDNDVYGAGTKLPHNVLGLVGVGIGVGSDALTGLPLQMVEVHEPVRLMIVVDQAPKIALKALKANPRIYEWIRNEWIHFACVDPLNSKCYIYQKGNLQNWTPDHNFDLKSVVSSEAAYAEEAFYVPFSKIIHGLT
ncbi:MAG: Na-translocating system protein MpsB, partial [Proteobacteria bacterium]|nr:Na-translocating system protein MpsB [Pseudomonadota bacterium]